MIAQCRVCGLILPFVLGHGEPPQQMFDRLAFAAFLHLLEQHQEHVEAACQPMMGKVANYVASLTFESTDLELASYQQAAREQISLLLAGLSWSEANRQFYFANSAQPGSPPDPVGE